MIGERMPTVFLFWDNSNIFISAKDIAAGREGRAARDQVRLHFENLLQLALAGRTLGRAFVVGSVPPEQRALWERLEAATGVRPELYERGQVSGQEQGLDQCLQVHMLRTISDNRDPEVAVLMTGDGKGYDDGVGFHADMERMNRAGWGIEVVSWERTCKRALRTWAERAGCFVRLEDYYESVTFLEGGRRAMAIDLSRRPRATPRPSPSKLVEIATEQRLRAEMQALQNEVTALKARKAAKDKKRVKYERAAERRRTG